MVDPLSVAGLTIAVLDDLIELGIWTAKVIQDVKAFDSDTRRLTTLIQSDTSRSQTLKTLLFAEASAYGGRTLFDQFDDDVQRQTTQLIEESRSILQAGSDILKRRYGIDSPSRADSPSQKPPLRTADSDLSSSTTLNNLTLTRSRSNSKFHTLLFWSVRDKNRVETIIKQFNEQNMRIQENIKLWSLANQLGVDLAHLQHLQNDSASKSLGFDLDATLRLTQRDAETPSGSLELPLSDWASLLQKSQHIPRAKTFNMLEKDGSFFIQENHRYEPPGWLLDEPHRAEPCGLDSGTMKRVEALAQLLQQPKEQVFRIPRCVGWRYLPDLRRISFVFKVDCDPKTPPISLLSLISSADDKKTAINPGPGDKYRLAAGLAACMAQLHMVGWVHESFRSENILFFPRVNQGSDHDIDFESPWIFGFDYSRPDMFPTAGNVDFIPERDIYRHPDRQGMPQVAFSRIHDIYALGVILLEIGLWEPAIKLQKDKFAFVNNSNARLVQTQLLKHATQRLEKRVGRKYKEMVVKCLQGTFGVENDNREDLKLQQAFRAQVVDVLQRAADAV